MRRLEWGPSFRRLLTLPIFRLLLSLNDNPSFALSFEPLGTLGKVELCVWYLRLAGVGRLVAPGRLKLSSRTIDC